MVMPQYERMMGALLQNLHTELAKELTVNAPL
jgi:hypothetical protein